MSNVIKDYIVSGKISNYDVINKDNTSAIIIKVKEINCILVEDKDVIDNIATMINDNKKHDIFGLLKDIDNEFNNYLLDVFGRDLLNKYEIKDKVLIIRSLK